MANIHDLNLQLKKIHEKLCGLNLSSSGSDNSDLLAVLEQIRDKKGTEGVELQKYCHNSVITGYSYIVLDEVTSVPTVFYLDTDLSPISTRPLGVIGDCSPDIAVETFFGSFGTLTSYTTLEVFVPKCLGITIATNVGTISLDSKPEPYYYKKDFKSNVTGYNLTTLPIGQESEVKTILTKLN